MYLEHGLEIVVPLLRLLKCAFFQGRNANNLFRHQFSNNMNYFKSSSGGTQRTNMLIPSPIIFCGHGTLAWNLHPYDLPFLRTVLVFIDLSLHVGSLLLLIQCLGHQMQTEFWCTYWSQRWPFHNFSLSTGSHNLPPSPSARIRSTKNLYIHKYSRMLPTSTLKMETECTSEMLAALLTFTRCGKTEEQGQRIFMTDLLSE
jgi:hypothetical protein